MSYYNLCGISYIQVDHSTVIFQKEKKGWKLIKKKITDTTVCKTPMAIVKIERNKYLTLHRY